MKAQSSKQHYFQRGRELATQGRSREAANILALALRKDPFQSELLCVMGEVQVAMRNYAFAAEYFRRAEESNPCLVDIYICRARMITLLGYLSRSRRDLEKAMKIAPKDARVFSELASYHFLAGQYEKARADVLYALELDPRDAKAVLLLAQISERTGRYSDALSLYEQVCRQLDPMNEEAKEGIKRIMSGKPSCNPDRIKKENPRTNAGDLNLSEGIAA
jgi:tetratricopeptide (TPR) repeat protein